MIAAIQFWLAQSIAKILIFLVIVFVDILFICLVNRRK